MNKFIEDLKRTHNCGQLSAKNIGEKVVLFGWIHRTRDHGELLFIDLRDREGITQLVLDRESGGELHSMAGRLRSEFVIAIEGKVQARPSGMINKKIPTVEIEVEISRLEILNPSKTPPFVIEDDVDAQEETRLRYRYLDLRRPSLAKNMIMRSKINNLIRNYFDKNGFLEIETPFLMKSTPEGARDYIVPSRVHPGKFFALPQSPQIFKQICMIAGLERYMQIVRCFRDEDLRADRQPEFTQIDVEMSFINEEDLFPIIEGLFKEIFREVLDIDLPIPFARVEYEESMRRFGTDKPDTRFGLELSDITEFAKNCGFKIFAEAAKSGVVKGIAVADGERISRKDLDQLGEFVKTYGAKGIAWAKVEKTGWQGSVAKFFDEELQNKINEHMCAKEGALLIFVADRYDIANEAMAHLRNRVGQKLGLIQEDLWSFLWVTHFPLFHFDYDAQRFVSAHHPFSGPVEEDVPLLKTDPGSVRGKTYDLTLNGCELGSGSIRIHDQELQQKIFSLLNLSPEEAKQKFGFLLEALTFGAPPHGGIALGLDRIYMLLAGAKSLRDVIAFPKTQKAIDLMCDAPSEVSADQLQELKIRITNKDKS